MLKRFFKSKFFVVLVVSLIKLYVWLVLFTCKITLRYSDKARKLVESKDLCFLSMWHSRILIFPQYFKDFKNFSAVVSSSGDGEFVAHAIESYGHPTIRGSTRKHGANAMRNAIALLKSGIRITVSPDGPKGPRYKVQGNMTSLAVKFEAPIIPVCFSVSRAIVLNTWDRFIIPLPFSKMIIELADPIALRKADDHLLEEIMNTQMHKLDNELNLMVDY